MDSTITTSMMKDGWSKIEHNVSVRYYSNEFMDRPRNFSIQMNMWAGLRPLLFKWIYGQVYLFVCLLEVAWLEDRRIRLDSAQMLIGSIVKIEFQIFSHNLFFLTFYIVKKTPQKLLSLSFGGIELSTSKAMFYKFTWCSNNHWAIAGTTMQPY